MFRTIPKRRKCPNCHKMTQISRNQFDEYSCNKCGCILGVKTLFSRTMDRDSNGSIVKGDLYIPKIKNNNISAYKEKTISAMDKFVRTEFNDIIPETQIVEMIRLYRITRRARINLPAKHNRLLAAYLYYATQFDSRYIRYDNLLHRNSELWKYFKLNTVYKTSKELVIYKKKRSRIKTILESTIREGDIDPLDVEIQSIYKIKQLRINLEMLDTDNESEQNKIKKQIEKIKNNYRRTWLLPQKQ